MREEAHSSSPEGLVRSFGVLLSLLSGCNLNTFGVSDGGATGVVSTSTEATQSILPTVGTEANATADTTTLVVSTSSAVDTADGTSGTTSTPQRCEPGPASGTAVLRKNLPWLVGGTRAGISGLGFDADENIVVGGIVVGGKLDVNCDAEVLVGQDDGYSLFVAKFDPSGAYMWHREMPGSGGPDSNLALTDLAVGADGHIVVVGQFDGLLAIPSEQAPDCILDTGDASGVDIDGFVASLDEDGFCLATQRLSSTGLLHAFIDRVRLDAAGRALISGGAEGPLALSGAMAHPDCISINSVGLGYVAVLDSELSWGQPVAQCIVTDQPSVTPYLLDAAWSSDGGILATGRIGAQARFQGQDSWTSSGDSDVVILALSPTGERIAHGCCGDAVAAENRREEGTALAVGPDGQVFVGMNIGDLSDCELNDCHGVAAPASQNTRSELVGLRRVDGAFEVQFTARARVAGGVDPLVFGYHRLAADGVGNVVGAGFARGDVDLGGGDLMGHGGYDAVLAKYACDGEHLWSDYFGKGGDDRALALALDVFGGPVVAGRCGAEFSGSCMAAPCAAFMERRLP